MSQFTILLDDEKCTEIILEVRGLFAAALRLGKANGGSRINDATFLMGWFKYSNGQVDFTKPKSGITEQRIVLSQAGIESLKAFFEYQFGSSSNGVSLDAEGAILKILKVFNAEAIESFATSALRHGLTSAQLINAVVMASREKILQCFEEMVNKNPVEQTWQEFFEANPWIFGLSCIRILDERRLSILDRGDHLVQADDGCVDLIELKRSGAPFWQSTLDHGNLVPTQNIIKAIMQAENYLLALERNMDSSTYIELLGGHSIVRPRATVVIGRSKDWTKKEFEAQRVLNDALRNVTVWTFDQVLARARRIVGCDIDSPSYVDVQMR